MTIYNVNIQDAMFEDGGPTILDGDTDNEPVFTNFYDWAVTLTASDTINLTIDPGSICIQGTAGIGTFVRWTDTWEADLVLTGTGATFESHLATSSSTITAIADNGSGDCRLTVTGDATTWPYVVIYIMGVTGTTLPDAAYAITVIGANTVDLIGTDFVGVYTGGGTVHFVTYDWGFGAFGVQNNAAHNGMINSVTEGATSVVLKTFADNSKFSVNQMVLLSGFDMQGGGYPPNPGVFELLRISSIDLTGGVCTISFPTPLIHTYVDTWPNYSPGVENEYMGAPALWVLSTGWDKSVEVHGLTINNNYQVYAGVRDALFQDCTFGGNHGLAPTLSYSTSQVNCTAPGCSMEVDKMINYYLIDGLTISSINVQSSSANYFEARNGCHITSYMNGTPGTISNTVDGCHFNSLNPGAYVAGCSGPLTITNSQIDTMVAAGTGSAGIDTGHGNLTNPSNYYLSSPGVIRWLNYSTITNVTDNGSGFCRLTVTGDTSEWVSGYNISISGVVGIPGINDVFAVTLLTPGNTTQVDLLTLAFSGAYVSGGAITVTKTINWPYPGGWYYFVGWYNYQPPVFQVLDCWRDSTHSYVSTTLTVTDFDDLIVNSTQPQIRTHPCTQLTVSNCTGAAGLSLNNHPAGRPFGEYYELTTLGGPPNSNYHVIWGNLVSIEVNVTVAYAGGLSPVFYFIFPAEMHPDRTVTNTWNTFIDPKFTGDRFLYPNSPATGTQPGDTGLTPLPGPVWDLGTLRPSFNADLTGSPVSVTTIINTNQGISEEEEAPAATQSQGYKYGVYKSRPIKMPQV